MNNTRNTYNTRIVRIEDIDDPRQRIEKRLNREVMKANSSIAYAEKEIARINALAEERGYSGAGLEKLIAQNERVIATSKRALDIANADLAFLASVS